MLLRVLEPSHLRLGHCTSRGAEPSHLRLKDLHAEGVLRPSAPAPGHSVMSRGAEALTSAARALHVEGVPRPRTSAPGALHAEGKSEASHLRLGTARQRVCAGGPSHLRLGASNAEGVLRPLTSAPGALHVEGVLRPLTSAPGALHVEGVLRPLTSAPGALHVEGVLRPLTSAPGALHVEGVLRPRTSAPGALHVEGNEKEVEMAKRMITETFEKADLEKKEKREKHKEWVKDNKRQKRQLYHIRHKADYEILGVPVGTSKADCKKAYRKLIVIWHPDKHQTKSDADRARAEKKFKEIQEAYDRLMSTDEDETIEQLGYKK
ncbi:hypothetical protein CYMTET_9221 [Cymbomonas tetramitiformis]|uniref:J domain-containing protein n=1 Tax=Cymbomonas tetramitiformis TaxID=36881 RepID=A0AAE0LF85_9CHLO|nr:hypothetical protein CYMTET_9221 [Cymbomonas tetramitiformis]